MENEMDLSIARFIREQREREEQEERERLRKQYYLYAGGDDRGDTKRTTVSLYIVAGV